MASSRLWILVLVALAASIQLSSAASHTVGGPRGWTFNVDYQRWASNSSFRVGDTLVFPYSSGHDVVEVTSAGYNTCQSIQMPSMRKYEEANPSVLLGTAGEHFYICSIPGHCAPGGMKLAINVSSASASTPSGSAPAAEPVPPSSSALTICLSQGAAVFVVLMAIFFF